MKIHTITCGWLEENCYIAYDEKTRIGYVIDPGEDGGRYLSYIEEKNIRVAAILLTHHHSDHSGAADEMKRRLGVPVFIHEEDMGSFHADKTFSEGDTFGDFEVIHTPGHTKGSSCFFNRKEKIAFTGDTVFNIDLGRTDFKDGSPRDMVSSVLKLDNMWDDDIYIFPGHGDGCTMGFVRRVNAEFKEITE